ncbi:MAG: hypothetical protein MJE66_20230, partial [Proteobacteria bacterium]|nr:hypothetical protein [Pseudomonadota bacterium]
MATTDRTPTAPPSGCTLAPEALEERRDWIQREIAPHAVRVQEDGNGVTCEFEGGDDFRATLAHWVELERACCSDWIWELEPRDAHRTRLRIRGPGAAAAFPALCSVLAARPPESRWRRLARAGGLGLAASFSLLCVLPMALAA